MIAKSIEEDNLREDLWGHKKIAIQAVIGSDKRVRHNCPCCQFAKDISLIRLADGTISTRLNSRIDTLVNCAKCPMSDFFVPRLYSYNPEYYYTCDRVHSPYMNWRKGCNNSPGTKKVALMGAQGMVRIAKEALEYWTSMKEMNVTW